MKTAILAENFLGSGWDLIANSKGRFWRHVKSGMQLKSGGQGLKIKRAPRICAICHKSRCGGRKGIVSQCGECRELLKEGRKLNAEMRFIPGGPLKENGARLAEMLRLAQLRGNGHASKS